MRARAVYRWVVFAHVLSAFLFMLAHGVFAIVPFQFRRERDPERIRALFDSLNATARLMRISTGLIYVTGIVAGFMGPWWKQGWFWASLVLLAAMHWAMRRIGGADLDHVWSAFGFGPAGDTDEVSPAPISEEALDEVRASRRPLALAWMGFVGLGIILWLMIFKPF